MPGNAGSGKMWRTEESHFLSAPMDGQENRGAVQACLSVTSRDRRFIIEPNLDHGLNGTLGGMVTAHQVV